VRTVVIVPGPTRARGCSRASRRRQARQLRAAARTVAEEIVKACWRVAAAFDVAAPAVYLAKLRGGRFGSVWAPEAAGEAYEGVEGRQVGQPSEEVGRVRGVVD